MSDSAQKGMRNMGRIRRLLLGAFTMIVIVALAAVLVLVHPPETLIDGTGQNGSTVRQKVSQNIVQSYCPAQMSLADSGKYGDSEYQASEGDITSSARQAAFGSVFESVVTPISANAESTNLQDSDPLDTASVLMSAVSVKKSPLIQTTQLLKASSGEGASSSVASWASKGDLRGISASNCVSPSLDESFLLPGTQTGSSQQLVVANPSSKSTAVSIRVWGSKSSGSLALSTGSTITVGAGEESVFDVSAAAPGQDALYVTVSSRETPVAAVVRSTVMDGLTPHGSDYATPLADASQSIALPGVTKGDDVSLSLFSKTDASVNVAWMTEKGLSDTHQYSLKAEQVKVQDLGQAPDDALGISVTSDEAVQVSATSSISGDGGQRDFGLVASTQAVDSSAIVLPGQLDATLVLANTANAETTLTLSGYDSKGKALEVRKVTLGANASTSVDADAFGDDVAAITLDDSDHAVVWNARLNSADLSKAKVAGLGFISETALMPRSSYINANQRPGAVR
ncbi:MAG: DUF5719 family protein [Bifidobacterium psychraerophilum]|uniref:DUF5719 family protein n=1 Tax=Bifidobacterium psychraerophilum TaxID=218140 RepID=UPI0039ED30E6